MFLGGEQSGSRISPPANHFHFVTRDEKKKRVTRLKLSKAPCDMLVFSDLILVSKHLMQVYHSFIYALNLLLALNYTLASK